ncbi:MAG: hypothetical protein JNL83_12960 [Myxococcales bacterium]|nr:hypothetical protein [Myxococcales bacterium]
MNPTPAARVVGGMRHCTTLAVILSLSACEHASQATQPSTPDPTPPPAVTSDLPSRAPAPAISARPEAAPAPEARTPLPKVPCRARVCPEWKTEPKLVADPRPPVIELAPQPTEDRRFGISRAGTSWRGERPRIRIQQKPADRAQAGK